MIICRKNINNFLSETKESKMKNEQKLDFSYCDKTYNKSLISYNLLIEKPKIHLVVAYYEQTLIFHR